MTKKILTFAVALFASAMMFAQPDYLCFTAETAMSAVSMKSVLNDWTLPSVQYSFDAEKWYDFRIDRDTIDLEQKGKKVYFRGTSGKFSFGTDRYVQFTMRGSVAASGNVMSLIDTTCELLWLPTRCTFINLFADCVALNKAPQLPAVGLTEYCYMNMFKGCTNLVAAPELPANQLKEYCYASMFEGCSKMNSMKVNFERWRPLNATQNWVKNVAPTGIFTCPNTLDATKIGWNNVPFGWNVTTFLGTPGLYVYIETDGKEMEIPIDSIEYIRFEKSNIETQGEDIYQLDMLQKDGTVTRIFVSDIDSMSILGYIIEGNNSEEDNKYGRMYVDGDLFILGTENSDLAKPSLDLNKTNILVDGEPYSFRNQDVEITFGTNRVFSHFEVNICANEYEYTWEEDGEGVIKIFYVPESFEYTFQATDGRDSLVTCTVNTRESFGVIELFDDVVAVANPDNAFLTYQWYHDGEKIEGANKQYYQEAGNLNGSYFVVVNEGTEDEQVSCPGFFNLQGGAIYNVQKRVSNGQLIIETTEGNLFDAQGQRL